jgi:pyrimidine-nucleoside phosphorylase
MRAIDIIRRKRDGHTLTRAEIAAFVRGATDGSWADYQLAAMLMAICCRGMDVGERAALTAEMVNSGQRLDLSDIPGPKVDKHSTGGVGDKTSLILAPLAAVCGVRVPMASGRGLGHSGGTLDKLESIPGFRVNLSVEEIKYALRTVGAALISQTREVAPADRVLYALRDVTGTVESIPLITASILSKKIAEGISGLVMDVKTGKGAFMASRDEARELARALVEVGNANGVHTEAVITDMNVPLGRAVGNAAEVIESIAVLRGERPGSLEDLSVHLAARMVRLAGLASTLEEAEKKVRAALTSGRGLEKFREIIANQGGDPAVIDNPARLPRATHRHIVRASRRGHVRGIHAGHVGRGSMLLGAGRNRADEAIDPAVAVLLHVALGQPVSPGDALGELHYNDPSRLAAALELIEAAFEIHEEPPGTVPASLILETLG